ncbi:MAG: hypothetical protein ACQETH_02965 [Candidatus Rifleibacteriota bacterium]
MKFFKAGFLLFGAMVLGGAIFATSTFAGPNSGQVLKVVRHSTESTENINLARVKPVEATSEANQKLLLVPPPKELPSAPSHQMVTSTRAFAPSKQVKSVKPNKSVVKKQVKQASAPSPAQKAKPENLFSYVRLLNYAPHPLKEEFLKDKPLTLNGKNYWFAVKYDEDWKVVGDEEGYIKGISFEIDMMERSGKVRSLKTPKVKINSATIKKGLVLGIAEVAPYKFTISVEEFKKSRKGISELVFKLDLIG